MNYEENKQRLLQMRADILRRVTAIERDLKREKGPLPADFAEQGVELENDEVLTALDDAGRRELTLIHTALKRIEDGEYGICDSCEADISAPRLKAVPFAVHCIDCAERLHSS